MASKNNEVVLAISVSLTCAGLIFLVIIMVIFLVLQKRGEKVYRVRRRSRVEIYLDGHYTDSIVEPPPQPPGLVMHNGRRKSSTSVHVIQQISPYAHRSIILQPPSEEQERSKRQGHESSTFARLNQYNNNENSGPSPSSSRFEIIPTETPAKFQRNSAMSVEHVLINT